MRRFRLGDRERNLWALTLLLAQCRPVEPPVETREREGTGGAGSMAGDPPGDTTGDAAPSDTRGTASNGAAPDAAAPESSAGSGGEGAAPDDAVLAPSPECAAQAAELAELARGQVRAGSRVALAGLVATTQKFLLYRSKSDGTCLWGVYAADATARTRQGVLVVTYGARAESAAAPCPTAGDAIDDDVMPGNAIAVQGEVVSFVPEACSGVPASVQLRLEPRCPLLRGGSVEPLPPVALDFATADAIASGDAGALAEWGGAFVELELLTARPVPGESDAVAPYGVVRVEETELEIHDAVAFMDLRGQGPQAANKSWEFAYPMEFARVRGVVHLDYCTWSLAPRDECEDLVPRSRGCEE